MTLQEARIALERVREHCDYGDLTAAVAFAHIVSRLTAGMDEARIASETGINHFVFEGLFGLRDWVFNTGFRPNHHRTAAAFANFEVALRYRLGECNPLGGYSRPVDVDGQALWRYFTGEFMPLVEAIRDTEGAQLDLAFLGSLTGDLEES